jgi:GMP synthase (glutamine-hydrolysing)
VQAFRYGEQAYGFQFHLEVDRPLIERWLVVPANQPMLEAEAGRVDPHRIRAVTPQHIGELQALSRATFGRWIERFDLGTRRRQVLPSR